MNINYFKEIVNCAMDVHSKYNERNYDIQNVVMFCETWGSTALGFKGWGGTSMTKAITTVVLKTDSSADVYFGGVLAYTVPKINDAFMEDLNERHMANQASAPEIYGFPPENIK